MIRFRFADAQPKALLSVAVGDRRRVSGDKHRIMKHLLLLFSCLGFLAAVVSAQQATEPVLKSLPKAVNPKDGYSEGGTVLVQVKVDEKGGVTEAEFARGPGPVCEAVTRPDVVATRNAAVAIARKAKFTSAMDGGRPVASTTIVSIEFAVPKPKPNPAPETGRLTVIGTTDEPKTVTSPVKGTATGVDADTHPNNDPAPTMRQDRLTVIGNADVGATTRTSASSRANDPNSNSRTISGGVLNGRAISLPKPSYPPAARAVRASGAVQVQVLIDEDGQIFSAEAFGGHPLLQGASVIAACSSKFSPTLLEGTPVKVSGIIVYNFVP